jgi:hypothetical protein
MRPWYSAHRGIDIAMHVTTLVWLIGVLGFVLVQGFVEWGTVFDGAAVGFAAIWFVVGLGIMGSLYLSTRRHERAIVDDSSTANAHGDDPGASGSSAPTTVDPVIRVLELQGIRSRYLVVWAGLAFAVLAMLVALGPNAFDVVDFAKDLLGQ